MDSLSNTATSSTSFASLGSGGSTASFSSTPRRAVRAGDIGFLAKEAVQQGVDKRHHIKTHGDIGVGLAALNAQKVNKFTQLPGLTFNERSFTSYMSTASAMRHTMQQQTPMLRGSSPRKAAGHY